MCLCHLNVLLEPDSTVVGVAILCDGQVKCNYDTAYISSFEDCAWRSMCNSFFL